MIPIKHNGHSFFIGEAREAYKGASHRRATSDKAVVYEMIKLVNGQPYAIGDIYHSDTDDNRETFIEMASLAFARAEAALYN